MFATPALVEQKKRILGRKNKENNEMVIIRPNMSGAMITVMEYIPLFQGRD